MFTTNRSYVDRKSKAEYIFDKYQKILSGSILDVGADAMYLKPILTERKIKYKGIGFGKEIDLEYNLENLPLPFESQEFETVLCFDVLEHLENIHDAFDELCRVAAKNIVISLPNPWSDFFTVLRKGDYKENEKIKFYGLPLERPIDRHRWFFSEKEATSFVNYRAEKNGWKVIQKDALGDSVKMGGNGIVGLIGRQVLKKIFRSDIDELGLHHSTLWFVLERK